MHQTNRSSPELLCPAGDFDAMRAAVANGADAVYFGLDRHNARHRAKNFRLDELPKIMAYLHRHNVRGFVTFNTLVFSDELPDAADYLAGIASAGVDAIIVQDLGIAQLAQQLAPTLEVHGSTQMTLTEPRGIEFVRQLGVCRVVVARELSITDIEKITQSTDMPLEVFVHGALCVAYSGQCLTSESLGGRSANRGQCAQACRMPYDLIVDGQRRDIDIQYLVSPTDLGAWDRIDELAKIGVASLKIEGRLKDPHYVAMTAQTYRTAIDEASHGRALHLDAQREADLNVVYSRTFTRGFLDGVDHQQLVPGRFPKARGMRVGKIVQRTSRGLFVELDSDRDPAVLKNGDGIVFDEGHPEEDEPHGQIYQCAVHPPRTPGKATRLYIELGNRDARPEQIALGAIVWKNSDPQLNRRLEHSFARDRVIHRSPIDFTLIARVGEAPILQATDGSQTIEATVDHLLQPAMKHPLTEEFARRQLDRLMDTPFALRSLTLRCDGSPMVPASVFSDLRRTAVSKLIDEREASKVHAIADADALVKLTAGAKSIERAPLPEMPQLHVLARTVEQVQALCDLPQEDRPASIYCDFEDVRRYALAVPIARQANVPITLATMRIIKPGEEGWLQQILKCNPDAILVRNLAGIGFYQQHAPHLPLIGDFSLNIANELTAKIFANANLVRMVPSYDLSWNQLAAMIQRFDPGRFECVVHQHMPMFHMEHCVFARTLSNGKDYRDCGRPCETHKVDLREQIGKSHPLIPDAGCRNTLFNGEAQSAMTYIPRMRALGIMHYRIELLRESPDEARRLIDSYREVLDGRAPARNALRSLRVLSQLGVTAGTLDRE